MVGQLCGITKDTSYSACISVSERLLYSGMDRDNLVLKDWTKSFSSFLSVKFSFKVLWWVPGTGQGALQKDIQSC